ncbi:zinc metallopeptidase [Actinoplanes sp. TBRC 11911]|uniref:zinc metallopeptidase n=1 Tax=Actinoplanes sp. TBRC 11911 TaxID=2729386 RepID=UPI00145F5ED7|nr:zinc metallopeptidase [Actinoplanes sp. TBRC 11911]NMO56220.1 zinc metallopeptidase [Actinoplanes sp. TBRC 11911]
MRAKALVTVAMAAALTAGCAILPDDSPSPAPAKGSDTVTRSLRDVERFWGDNFPDVGGGARFEAVRGGYFPYTETHLPPDCGGQPSQYQPNAFYCTSGDFIAWDAQNLVPQLESTYGPLLVGVVMAHEYGHAVQTRLGRTREPTVVLEQQADCYAGAWLGDVLNGRSPAFRDVTAAQLDNTIAGLLMLRDQPGTSATADQAHGNAFDRVRALQDGVEQGPETCAGYAADNLPVTEIPFLNPADEARGGDLPYADAVNLLANDAQEYWRRTFPALAAAQWTDLPVRAFDASAPPACPQPDSSAGGRAFYCPDGDFVAFDNSELGPTLYRRIGDNAVGMLLGDLFARAAQDRRGASTRDRAGQLAVDCLAGSWTNDLLTRQGNTDLRLSPGDLDEAVTALLAFGRAEQGAGPTAFDRISAYRKGVLQGLDACG